MLDAVVVENLSASLCSVGQIADHHNVGILFTSDGAYVVPKDAYALSNGKSSRTHVANRSALGLYHTDSALLEKALQKAKGKGGISAPQEKKLA